MFKKSIFLLISWLLLISVVGCAQVEADSVAQNTLPATQAVDTPSPTDEPADEVDVVPALTDPTTEPAGNSGEAATSTAMPQPTATLAPTATPATSAQNSEEEKSMATEPINQGTETLVRQAIEDLAQRLNVTPEEIEVVEVQAVTWGDTSMGCPQPDMRYKQVPQDGLLIKLSVDGEVYEYHSGGTRDPFLCEKTLLKAKPTSPKIGVEDFVTPPSIDN